MQAQTASRVDVSFPLSGTTVPLDHGYALFGALCRVLGDLHGAEWLAVHPLRGIPVGEGRLDVRRGNLVLRVEPAQIQPVLTLAGRTLELGPSVLNLGASHVQLLQPASVLRSRLVVIKKFMEADPFRDAVKRQLDEMGVQARVEIGRRRVLRVADDTVVGFETVLHEISDEHSLRVQSDGVGGRQRFGCGVFRPVRARS